MMTRRRSRRGALALAAAALAVAAALAMPMFVRPAAAYAAPAEPPTVVYDSAAREFSVRNADGGSLFDMLENLVPGDSSSHTVAVRVENARTPVALYLLPGSQFHVVDALVTNFHVPRSTLMMLVSAFSSREHIMAAYRHAIEQRYRLLSFGDAMFIC